MKKRHYQYKYKALQPHVGPLNAYLYYHSSQPQLTYQKQPMTIKLPESLVSLSYENFRYKSPIVPSEPSMNRRTRSSQPMRSPSAHLQTTIMQLTSFDHMQLPIRPILTSFKFQPIPVKATTLKSYNNYSPKNIKLKQNLKSSS